MNPWLTLYLKELKENRSMPLMALVAGLAVQIYVIASVDWPLGPRHAPLLLLVFLPVAVSVLLGPFLLAHAFTSEWKGNTHYLALSLPIPKWWVGLSKCAAVASLSGLMYLVSAVTIYGMYVSEAGRPESNSNMIGPIDFWLVAVLWLMAISVLLLGLVVGLEGVRLSVKRYRGYAGAGFLVLCAYGLAKALGPGVRALSFLGKYRIDSVRPDGTVLTHSLELSHLAFPALAGLLLLVLGLYLLDRFVEI